MLSICTKWNGRTNFNEIQEHIYLVIYFNEVHIMGVSVMVNVCQWYLPYLDITRLESHHCPCGFSGGTATKTISFQRGVFVLIYHGA